jgi:hypothetical protein
MNTAAKISKSEIDIFKEIHRQPDGHLGKAEFVTKRKKPKKMKTAAEHPGIAQIIDEIGDAARNAHGATPSESWPVYPATTPKTGQVAQQAQRAPGHSTYQHAPSAAAMSAARNAQPSKAAGADDLRKFDASRRPMTAAEIAEIPGHGR